MMIIFSALFLGSFLGGIFFQWVLASRPLEAAGSRILQADQLWLYGPDGKHRMQFGTYTAHPSRASR